MCSLDFLLYPTFTLSTSQLAKLFVLCALKELVPDFQLPSRQIDPSYSNQYDLWLPRTISQGKSGGIRIEIKASRAVDFNKSDEPLYIKALSSDSRCPFDMNFQQIKPKCADVFIWVAVWRDKIRYWVLSSNEVQTNRYFSKGQHRGNVGEGQLHINGDNIADFDKYEVKSTNIRKAVIAAYKRQMKRSK
jgi:hypothetical protein